MARSKTVTVTTAAQDVVIQDGFYALEITNVDGAGIVYARNDGTTAVAAADDTVPIPASPGAFVVLHGGSKTVSLIATASTLVGVRGVDR